ncbi:MAG TPA: phosphotransferase [Candidatus Nanopelagicales bacterium]|nr:phosphotransferase [Candidatus Nanopelagicales bacterium]
MTPFHELTVRGRARRLRGAVDAALAHYPLDVVRVRLIINETNGIFRVDTSDGARHVVRVGLGGEIAHSAREVFAETEWLAALAAETDLPVPIPVATRDGAPFVTVEVPGVPDPRNVVVFSWLEGRPLGERLTTPTMRAYGALSARLHAHGAAHRPSSPDVLPRYDRLNPFDEPFVVFEAEHPLVTPARRAVFAAAAEVVADEIDALRRSGEPMRVLHGDLHPWNVMASRRGLAPFDFEDLMWGWPVQDVATSLYYLQGPDLEGWVTSFRDGYETVAPWPECRSGQVATFMIGRALVLANDLLITPEWQSGAAPYLERYEARFRTFLADRPIRSGRRGLSPGGR